MAQVFTSVEPQQLEQTLDFMAIGRLGVDLYPTEINQPIEVVEQFTKSLGGTAANVSVAVARYGHSSQLVSRVGADPFGRYLLDQLTAFNVSNEAIGTDPELPTPLTFCEIFPPDDFPLYFYRYPKAPDLNVSPDQWDDTNVRTAKVLWLTGTGLSTQPTRETHHALLKLRDRRQYTIFDLDYRPMFWQSKDEARAEMAPILDQVTVAVGNQEECEVAVGESDPHRAADALLEHGLQLAVVKQGPRGVLAKTATETVEVGVHQVKIKNGLGAGDGFGGALVHGLLQGWDLKSIIEFANVAGAIVASRVECSTAMPTETEVRTELEKRNGQGASG